MRHVTPTDYLHKREPWQHQDAIFRASRDEAAWGFFMEQGTGKGKVMVDTAAWGYMQGRIDAVLLVCDKGIVRTWLEEHLPENMPDHVPYHAMTYDAAKAGGKRMQAQLSAFLRTPDALMFMVTNWAAFRTDRGRKFFETMVRTRQVLMMLDESDAIKSPKAKQTRAITTVGKRAAMRRIATGTPVADGPFDVFSQMRFLDPGILAITSFTAFKHEYGDWEKRFTATHSYPHLVAYRDLGRLHGIMARHSSRVLKEECFDLPPKVYERLYVELGAAASAMYGQLKEDLVYLGEPVTQPLVALTRAAQIASGFYQDADGMAEWFDEQPKADAVVALLKRMGSNRQAVVWGQFHAELDILAKAMHDAGITIARYDGRMPMHDRDQAERLFKAGDCQVMLATSQAAGKGRNWQNASAMFYHSNSPKLILRLQSEDRAHRGGTQHSVTLWDICAEGTGDAKRLDALRGKKNVADIVNGDNVQEWL